MAYDEALANEIREAISAEPGVREQRMFGGLAFLVNGNMAVAASGQGGLLVRVDPQTTDRLVESTAAEPMIMNDRPMTGWLRIGDDALRTERVLRAWVERGVSYARSLPTKSR